MEKPMSLNKLKEEIIQINWKDIEPNPVKIKIKQNRKENSNSRTIIPASRAQSNEPMQGCETKLQKRVKHELNNTKFRFRVW